MSQVFHQTHGGFRFTYSDQADPWFSWKRTDETGESPLSRLTANWSYEDWLNGVDVAARVQEKSLKRAKDMFWAACGGDPKRPA